MSTPQTVTTSAAPFFRDTVPAGQTRFFEIPIRNGSVGAHVLWFDSVANAAITVSFSSRAGEDVNAPVARWADSNQTFTGPTAAGPGSLMINIDNIRQQRCRIGVAATAATLVEIWDGTAP